jgi:NAD-dependent deacetylase
MPVAEELVASAEVLVVVGTSLQVYPAASLAFAAPPAARRFLIDPDPPAVSGEGIEVIAKGAAAGLAEVDHLLHAGRRGASE